MIQQLNFIRRENPALQQLSNITFLDAANDALIAYAKQSARQYGDVRRERRSRIRRRRAPSMIPASLGLPPSFTAHDLLSDERYQWRIGPNYVRLEPGIRQAHVLRVET